MKPSNETGETPLKRVVGVWGSFAMGYADVGADVYIALGLIAFYAASAAPLALAFAAITYICTGLSYAELASTYPVAGGAQFYSYRAFGRLHGFAAGWGLMLDYTIDIALFALAAIGYLGVFSRFLGAGTQVLVSPWYGFTAIILILLLVLLNLLGIRWSSAFNEIFVLLNVVTLGILLAVGIPYIVSNGAALNWLQSLGSLGSQPSWEQFAYATSFAMISYIGIESISQAAEETRNPRQVIPRATKGAIFAITVFATLASILSVTLVPWQVLATESQAPLVGVVSQLPAIGALFAVWIAFMGFMMCFVSTNTGVIGVSRVTFSMGRLGLMPKQFTSVSTRFRTPYLTIILFSSVATLLILAYSFLDALDLLHLIASLYSFGALVAYMYVNLSLVALRFRDPTPRSWKVPLNVRVPWKGMKIDVPIPGVIGFLSCLAVWFIVVGTHEESRLLGAVWFAGGIVAFLLSTRLKKKR